MKSLKDHLRDEIDNLKHSLMKTKKELTKYNKINGSLWIDTNKGNTQYYLHSEEYLTGRRRKYISKSDKDFIRNLARKSYLTQAVNILEEQYFQLTDLYKKYDENALVKLTAALHPERRKLIDPIVLPEEEYVEKWLQMPYEGKPFEKGQAVLLSEREERVRSKSEKIIADKLLKEGIPYRYECPLNLGSKAIYPDFTVLNKRTRQEFYLEHFGMMDDLQYCNGALSRIELYEKNGLFLGEHLLATFETRKMPLDTRMLDLLIKHYLL